MLPEGALSCQRWIASPEKKPPSPWSQLLPGQPVISDPSEPGYEGLAPSTQLGMTPKIQLSNKTSTGVTEAFVRTAAQLSCSLCPILLPSLMYILHVELVSGSASQGTYPVAVPLGKSPQGFKPQFPHL